MPKLNWISDENLNSSVKCLLEVAQQALKTADKKFERNVIDPFAAMFEMSGFNLDYQSWIKGEKTRQSQKTLSNKVGEFHQNVLGAVPHWEDQKIGKIIDLVSSEKKIIAEIKNKHNTIKQSNLSTLYHSLEGLVMPKHSKYKGFTAYYVAIIPKKKERFNREFIPSDKDKGAKCANNPLIREIDGASFYHLVTGEENALSDLFNVVPDVVQEITGGEYLSTKLTPLRNYFDRAFQTI